MIGNKFEKGFTFVELMISAAAFSVVFSAAIAVLVMSIKYQRYNLVHNELINEANYAMEFMARALRMAQAGTGLSQNGITCPNGFVYNVSPNNQVTFTTYDGACRQIYWDTDSNSSTYNQIVAKGLLAGLVPLTSDNFQVMSFRLDTSGDDIGTGDGLQPKITIYLDLKAKNLPDKPEIKLQTTVSQRNLDM